MKFFTRVWIWGEMTDAEVAAVPDAYPRYLATLRLPPTIAALAQVNLHDALLLAVEHQHEQSRITLHLRCGDLQRGYSDVTLAFSQVVVDPTALETLRRAVRPARVEVLYDEIDRSGDGFEYRLLLDSADEVSLRFRQVELAERLVANRDAG